MGRRLLQLLAAALLVVLQAASSSSELVLGRLAAELCDARSGTLQPGAEGVLAAQLAAAGLRLAEQQPGGLHCYILLAAAPGRRQANVQAAAAQLTRAAPGEAPRAPRPVPGGTKPVRPVLEHASLVPQLAPTAASQPPAGATPVGALGHACSAAGALELARCLLARATSAGAAPSYAVAAVSASEVLPLSDSRVQVYRDAITQHVCSRGGVLVVPAGDGGVDVDTASASAHPSRHRPQAVYPAALAERLPCVLAVASLAEGDSLAASTSYGRAVGIAAPGTDSLGVTSSATAAARVAEAAQQLRDAFPAATGQQVVKCLVDSATRAPQPPRDPAALGVRALGGGVLDVAAARTCLAGLPNPCTCARNLPACVEPSTGVVVPPTLCNSTTHLCQPLPHTTAVVCRFGFRNASYVCRAAAGLCDVADTCTGTEAECPEDSLLPAGTVCASWDEECTADSLCDGLRPACPGKSDEKNGTPCSKDAPGMRMQAAFVDGALATAASLSKEEAVRQQYWKCQQCLQGACIAWESLVAVKAKGHELQRDSYSYDEFFYCSKVHYYTKSGKAPWRS